jgi:hypothetical protein
VIVIEDNGLTIYDGDDPDLPMWMKWTSTTMLRGGTSRKLAVKNGIIATSNANTYGGLVKIYFVSDTARSYRAIGSSNSTEGYWKGNIAGRNDYSSNNYSNSSGGNVLPALVRENTNDVAMTVLPNAPIDPSTGLPIPTIAVATNGGTSVIKDNGTVVDFNDALGSTRPVSTVAIRGNDILHWNINNGTLQQFFDALSATADSNNDVKYNYTASGGHSTCENVSALLRNPGNGPYYLAVRDSKSIAAGAQPGMSVFVDGSDRISSTNSHSIFDSRVAYITSDYNTGWMHGDIKGAFLSDTDIEDGVELVSNGTFSANTTGWTVVGGGSATVSSGQAQLTNNGTSNASLDQTVTTVVGKTYEVRANITPQGGGPMPRLYAAGKYAQVASNSNSSQLVSFVYTATSTSTTISVNANTNVNNAVTLADNISVKLTNDITGSNLIDNGDFGTGNFTNWSTSGTTAPTISSGGALLTTGAADGAIWQSTSGEATSGKWNISWTVTTNSGGFFGLYLGNDGANGSGGSLVKDSITTSGSYYYEGNVTAVEFRHRGASSGIIDNITLIRVGDEDRSVNNQGLQVFGTVTKSAVATGAELVAYSGFSGSNYLKQPFTATTINHGTGDFCYVMWVNIDSSGTDSQTFVDRSSSNGGVSNPRIRIHKHTNGVFRFYTNGGSVNSTTNLENIGWTHLACVRRGSTTEVWVNGYLENTGSSSTDFTSTAGQIQIGVDGDESDPLTAGSITLVRISHSAPSAEQIKKMYEDEKVLFQENAKCTLYGSSDAVTALAYDEVTDQLHVGTSAGRSEFQGLCRINNTTTAVTTAISAHDGFIVEQ